MPRSSGPYQHVIRVVALFGAGFLTFLVIRHFLIPPGFGQYGFYRAGALDDVRARPISYAGRETCAVCHDPVVTSQKGSRHATVGCEACHGPLAKHAAGDFDVKPRTLEPKPLCLSCHTKMAGKADPFPQVDPAEHFGDLACTDCHSPHHPKLGAGK